VKKFFPDTFYFPAYIVVLTILMVLWVRQYMPEAGVYIIPFWMIILLIFSWFSRMVVLRYEFGKLKRWSVWVLTVFFLITAWILTLRLSAVFMGSSDAWNAKWINLVLALTVFSGDYFFERICRHKGSSLVDLENKLSLKEMELEFVKNQLNPHFLFNSLNNIAATIVVDKEMALEYTYKLSELLRYQVGISGRYTVTLEEEESYISNYLDIEKLRLGGRCEIRFEAITPDRLVQIPPLLLHPLVEYSLKKSLALNGKSEIQIKLISEHDAIQLDICHSLPESPANQRIKGLDIETVKKRLNLLFPGRYVLKVKKSGSEAELNLTIQLHRNSNNT